MSFSQMRHCNIAPLYQLGICHNNVTVDNTFPTCFGGVQDRICICMYVCMYVCILKWYTVCINVSMLKIVLCMYVNAYLSE